ncbi:Lipoprotein LpqB, GerMN domain protein [Gracilinema caldarium DSM 7334]|uniref:Lipoprotein LpqB, GerMN domain protein n=1 Tax=Gracilinema caldarium (strain ATCC 51460 / DSM 7334 / H1) TaxID=744872 RepID=F8F163_GRAC1|nr:Lipoprotein LpqB, GerMN domain protein [Gracilinema caldarium DSM 7334]
MVDPLNDSTYHTIVTAKRTKKKKNNAPLGCLAGIIFVILLSGLLLLNKTIIEKNLKNTGFFEKILPKTTEYNKDREAPQEKPSPPSGTTEKPIDSKQTQPQTTPTTPQAAPSRPQETIPKIETKPDTSTKQITQPEKTPQVAPKDRSKTVIPAGDPKETPPPTKERALYFMQITEDGSLIRTKVSRSIVVSDSPLVDVIQSLLSGPLDIEKKRGLISVIPSGSRLLSAQVKDGIAYLDFNDTFQFNTFGKEGYTAQLKQVVWTATEFPTVQGVQILIEGKRLTYLGGEGIRVDRPLTRTSF